MGRRPRPKKLRLDGEEARQSDPATKERIAELARQVAAGEYDPKRRMREVFGMSVPSKERKR